MTFAVKELRRIVGSLNTMVGNQEGSVMAGVKFPNIGGRGERFQVNISLIIISEGNAIKLLKYENVVT